MFMPVALQYAWLVVDTAFKEGIFRETTVFLRFLACCAPYGRPVANFTAWAAARGLFFNQQTAYRYMRCDDMHFVVDQNT